MATRCFKPVRGKVIRATLLDACGNPDAGANSVSVSKDVTQVAINEVTEEGTNVRERNFGGEMCIVDDAFTEIIGYDTDIDFCGVDPGLITLLTGQSPVVNAVGDIVGFDIGSDVDLDSFGFALEVWSRLTGASCAPGGARPWGYTLFPFIKGGRLSNFAFTNGAVQFTLRGARTRIGNGWGSGPYDVDRDLGGNPIPLFEPIGTNTHFRAIEVTLDPPEPSCGTFALASA